MCIESRFAVAILAEVGLRVGLPRHMQNQFFVQIVYSDHTKVVTVHTAHQLTIHVSLHYSTSNPHYIDGCLLVQHVIWDNLKHCVYTVVMCLWQNLMSCVYSSSLLWLCLTTSHFNTTCSAPDMVWTWHVCSSACRVLSHWCHTVCSVDISTIEMQSVINLLIFGIKKWI